MPAIQPNATAFNPNTLDLTLVATYERVIGASMTRVWENVLDWEHLPHLHETSFDHVALIEAGSWGWRTWSDPDRQGHIELTVAGEDSYVARSYQGDRQISEIWTELAPVGDSVKVRVSFYLPDVSPDDRDKLGDRMLGLYTRLWDEDEQMMAERERRLTENRSSATEVDLGAVPALRDRLAAGVPITFQLGRREFRLREAGGTFLAHQSICPHLLGPLSRYDPASGTVSCPWHGYRFNLADGNCVTPADAGCRLGPAPELHQDGTSLIARLR